MYVYIYIYIYYREIVYIYTGITIIMLYTYIRLYIAGTAAAKADKGPAKEGRLLHLMPGQHLILMLLVL